MSMGQKWRIKWVVTHFTSSFIFVSTVFGFLKCLLFKITSIRFPFMEIMLFRQGYTFMTSNGVDGGRGFPVAYFINGFDFIDTQMLKIT